MGGRRGWVAHCKSAGTGRPALIYLGRYLYRGVIRENDILAVDNGQVRFRFRFRNAKTGRFEHRTLPGADFLWLILQHVLPKGFRRARNFGFLHPNCKRLIALLHLLLRFDPQRATEGTSNVRRFCVRVLWCGDDDRANADSIHRINTRHDADSHRGNLLTV